MEQSFDRTMPMLGVGRRGRRTGAAMVVGDVSSPLVTAAGGDAVCMAERLQSVRDRELNG